MSDPSAPARPRRILYGRRFGPRLRPQRKRLLDERLPELRLQVAPDRATAPRDVFPDGRPLWLELGFGGGEHLAAVAEAHPQVGVIGVEPFMSGVAALLGTIESRRLDNVRVVVDDARLLLDSLPDASVERIFILFPDPWPKARHHKRRLVNAETARACARLLVQGGRLELATDHMDYARAMLQALLPVDDLVWTATRPADWRTFPELGHPTRYEAKARAAGRPCVYLVFERRSGASSAKA
ncbi:tRNA (guanosine(46)-N7)-methyltransferase TrmB [Marinivivus vitaminiproducens]|uniref:tRNA (guanosine(46)-N7)-methyltransferase TrmB n=1 Tax=Marinivivus vitaminiproducens TaxID=3035935 RepID=UPI0027A1BA97|nr:tRNA (guanosine(46)-N7)-methyltransferase TrmB [Geminicoccaceae bacterium SCSIO 64248]